MNNSVNRGEGTVLPYRRIPINKYNRNNGNGITVNFLMLITVP